MARRQRVGRTLVATAWSVIVMALATIEPVSAQAPGGCTTPVSQRTSEIGCYFTASEVLDALPPGPLFWHLHQFPTHAAATAAKGPHGTVVESFGKIWLYTIADASWRPSGGERVAVIGSLPIGSAKQYTARYMEAVFAPGMQGGPHRHSGPEAWYVLSGAQCLETSEGIIVARTGEGALVKQGPPMIIKSVGTETRRAVLLVLHDASQPWITPASKWKPTGLCPE